MVSKTKQNGDCLYLHTEAVLRIFKSIVKNLLMNSQAVAVSNQRSAFSLNMKYFYHKKLIIKHKLII